MQRSTEQACASRNRAVFGPWKRNVQYVMRVLQVEYCKVHVCSSASDCCRRRRSCARSAGGSHTCEVTGVALAYAYACLLWRLPRAHCWQWIETFRPVTGATSQMTLVGIPLDSTFALLLQRSLAVSPSFLWLRQVKLCDAR